MRCAQPACRSWSCTLSNPNAREPVRQRSLTAGAALGVVQGFGALSYELALRGLMGRLDHEA